MQMKRLSIYILTACMAVCCVYPFNPELPAGQTERLVIGGDIIIGGSTEISVSRVFPLSSEYYEPAKVYPRASVVIQQEGSQETVSGVPYGNGIYILKTEKLDPAASYRLSVSVDGKTYLSPWAKALPAPRITSLNYAADDKNVNVLLSLDGGQDASDFRWTYVETWEYSADFVPSLMYLEYGGEYSEDPEEIYRARTDADDYFYCWNSSSNTEYCLATAAGLSSNRVEKQNFLQIPRSSKKMSVLYSIEVKARSISHDAYAFLDNIKESSNISGSLFTPVPSDIRGNIRNAADTSEFVIGYVSVVTESSKRYFIDAAKDELFKRDEDPESLKFFPFPDEDGVYNFYNLYKTGNRPVGTAVPGDVPTKTNVYWAPSRCTDCRTLGGSKTKPSYWPNDHK